MQTIARANRVCSYKIDGVEKKNGEVVDYFGVFGRLKKAIKDYGQGNEGDDPPVRDKEELFRLLNEAIEQGRAFCKSKGVQIEKVLEADDVFLKIGNFEEWANLLLHKDEWRKSFSVYENTITGLYEASKPEILGDPVVRVVAAFQYLRGVIESIIEQQDIESAARRISELLDESVVVDKSGKVNDDKLEYRIAQTGKAWDLSKIDFDKLQDEFKKATYKNIKIADLRAFLEKKLAEVLKQNRTRLDFAQRLQNVIEDYNAGSSSADASFDQLMAFTAEIKEGGI